MTGDDNENDQTRDVYAHFGLAMFQAQVLEHGIVNAMVIGRMHERERVTRSQIDAFMDAQFDRTLGQLLRELARHIDVPPTVEPLLRSALSRRNWLAHAYFRERAVEFMTTHGRSRMIEELEIAAELFRSADRALDDLTRGIRERFGIDDAAIEREADATLTAEGGS